MHLKMMFLLRRLSLLAGFLRDKVPPSVEEATGMLLQGLVVRIIL
jgi:hypothetical protein